MVKVRHSFKNMDGYGILMRTVRFLGIPVFKSRRIVFFNEDANVKVL